MNVFRKIFDLKVSKITASPFSGVQCQFPSNRTLEHSGKPLIIYPSFLPNSKLVSFILSSCILQGEKEIVPLVLKGKKNKFLSANFFSHSVLNIENILQRKERIKNNDNTSGN